MGSPEDTRLPPHQCLASLTIEWRVPAPGINAHHAYALFVQPARSLSCHAAAAEHVVGLSVVRIAARPHQHNVEQLESIANTRQLGLRISSGYRVALGLSGHI